MRRTATVLLFLLVSGPIAAAQTIRYVDDDAAPGGDGLSWATAYDTLPPALTAAQPGDQIWVAAGTYVGNFTLAIGVEMYGGFAGTETLLEQRDWTVNETFLDGNQTGSVITALGGATETTRIDGFTITNGSGPFGGGLYLSAFLSDPAISNCRFVGNTASEDGGAIWVWSASAWSVTDTVFVNNHADGLGGAIAITYGSLLIELTEFTGNTAGSGGAVHSDSSEGTSMTLLDVAFRSNSATGDGGAIRTWGEESLQIRACTFEGNTAGWFGGALYHASGFPNPLSHVANSTFVGNHAQQGGAFRSSGPTTTFVNCIFSGNTGSLGAALYTGSGSIIDNCSISGNAAGGNGGGVYAFGALIVVNSILWGNSDSGGSDETAQIYVGSSGTPSADYCCIQGYSGTYGFGNIASDPLFADADGPDDVMGTPDDDLSIIIGSPCIDAGDNAAVPADELDLDSDGDVTEPTPHDRLALPRFRDDPFVPDTGSGARPVVDMGAYEFNDCNHNGVFDLDDIAAGTSEDCAGEGVPDECEPDCNTNAAPDSCDIFDGSSADCNGNTIPDECDLADLSSDDCNTNQIPDECEPDCNSNLVADECDITDGTSQDQDLNGVPDECELGACCAPDGICEEIIAPLCVEGVWSATVACDPNLCPQPGACLFDELLPPDAAAGDSLGRYLALDGDRAAVTGRSNGQNAVHIFTRTGTEWNATAVVAPASGIPSSEGHVRVALQGNYLVIGAKEDSEFGAQAGAAYVFRYEGGAWVERQKLIGSTAGAGDNFGVSVAIDLPWLMVGAYAFDSGDPGAAYVYRLEGDVWLEQQELLPSDSSGLGDLFGRPVDIDGSRAVVGRIGNVPQFDGAAYSYIWNGSQWVEEQKITPSDGEGEPLLFSLSLALDGDTLAVGAPGDSEFAPQNGSVYTFRLGTDGWTEEAELHSSAPSAWARFGDAVGLAGAYVVVGAHDDPSVYTYRFSGAEWTEETVFASQDWQPDDRFGAGLAVSGPYVLLSSEDDDSACDPGLECGAGAAYIYGIIGDCDDTGRPDVCEIADGSSSDCSGDAVPDHCEEDCNANANPDPCDIIDGTSQDCAGEGVPDECEPDCNTNGAADSCDIFFGTSADCNSNSIPDECDIAGQTSADCDSNQIPDECQPDGDGDGVPDTCDICPGHDDSVDGDGDGTPDGCDPCPIDNPDDADDDGVCASDDNCELFNPDQLDCQPNATGDVCDIASGTSPDTNANGIPDECEFAGVLREDSLGTTCTGDEDCDPPGAVCVEGICYVLKNRYLSLDPNPANAGLSTARRVSLYDLGGQNVMLGWVGEPTELAIAGPETTPQLLARIDDVPHHRDWSVDNGGQPWVDSTVHVGDCETSPGRTYLVEAIVQGMDINDDANYSAALMLRTAIDFGDVVGATTGTPPDGVRNFKDISAVVRGFQSIQSEPKVWLDLQGGTATPEIPDFSDVNFADINHAVSGFQGGAYPFAAPCDCPGQSCP